MFADDLTALNIGKKGDLCKLQEDISRIQNWCDVNRLYLNAKKCSIMPVRGIKDAQLVISDLSLKIKETCTDHGRKSEMAQPQ